MRQPDGPVLGRDLGLDAPPGAAVAGDHDLALHVHPVAGEDLVVGGHPVVDVHEGGFHVAVDGVAVVDRELLLGLARGRVLLQGGLGETGHEPRGRRHLEEPRLRGGEEDIEDLDARVVAPGPELRERPFRVVLAVRRAHRVGPGGQALHPAPEVLGLELAVEPGFESTLGLRGVGREAAEGLFGGSGGGGQEGQGDEGESRGQGHGAGNAHTGGPPSREGGFYQGRTLLWPRPPATVSWWVIRGSRSAPGLNMDDLYRSAQNRDVPPATSGRVRAPAHRPHPRLAARWCSPPWRG